MKERVRKILHSILESLNLQITDFELKEPPPEIKFDLATNLPIAISKAYKINPQEVFEKIKKLIDEKYRDVITEIRFFKPGFLNFNLNLNFYLEEIKNIILQKEKYPIQENLPKEKILLEFVSANPTGPLHIGHGRCAVLGDVLGNTFKKLGYNLTKEYYVNDRGRQIQVLTASVIESLLDFNLQDVEIENDVIEWTKEIVSETKYKGKYISEIALKLKKEFKKINKDNIDKVQKFIVETIMDEIKQSLKNFKVEFDNYFYESSLYESKEIEKIKKFLEEKELIEKKDGAIWFKSQQTGDTKDRVIIKSDGEPTYFFSDIVYHYNKINREFDWLINIWGTDHHGYVDRLEGACEKIFEAENKKVKLDIILYQLVSLLKEGQRIAMSTREGKFITLDEVVNEVGSDVTRFFLLTKSPDAHLEFDFDKAKEHSLKNPVYYIQYAHTRCCGIIKEAIGSLELPDSLKLMLLHLSDSSFREKEEVDLIKKLCFYPDILYLCIDTFSPHHLCNYLIEVAKIFHKFYETCRVIEKDNNVIYPRLFLVFATKIILNNALKILGISAPEKM